ncbi:zinc finger, CCHC-type containing protein [Tanacetum coccineum]
MLSDASSYVVPEDENFFYERACKSLQRLESGLMERGSKGPRLIKEEEDSAAADVLLGPAIRIVLVLEHMFNHGGFLFGPPTLLFVLKEFVNIGFPGARLECSSVVEHQPNFDGAQAACKFKILELNSLIEKKRDILKTLENLDYTFRRCEGVLKIEDALTGLEVIEYEGNQIRLSLRTYIPDTDLSEQNHELAIELLDGTLELRHAEIFPNDVYIGEIMDGAKSFAHQFPLLPLPDNKNSLEWFVRKVQDRIVLSTLRKSLVKAASKSRLSIEYEDRDEMIVAHLVDGVDAFIKVPQGWPIANSGLKLSSLKRSSQSSQEVTLSFICKVEEMVNSLDVQVVDEVHMSVVYVLTTLIFEDGENATVEQLRKRAKWINDDYICRGLILNGMSDPLFDIYQNVESFKELWDFLEAKYMAEDASSKKFLVSNFTNYKMTDSTPVMKQYNELLGILKRFKQHKINMDEAIQVSCIIDKLPSFWKDFKHTLKHQKEELTLVELGSHLCIEESLRVQDNDKPKGNNVAGPSVVNMVEHNNSIRYTDNRVKRKYQDTKADPNNKPKVTYWKCGKPGHLKKDCKGGKVGNKANGSSTNGLDDDITWWVDSGAIVYVCKDRCWFKTYESLNDGSILHMRNESTSLVHGRGCVDLRFSSGKIVSLFNVLHVPNIRKNLVSSSILNNCGYKQVIESNKFVLSKHGVFIGFGHLSNQMFRLNIVNDNIGSAFMSTSRMNDSILWHARLGHVHYKRMQDIFKDELILAFNIDIKKCKTCMLTKITKKPFQNVKRKTEVLELIHSDLCDLHATPSLGNKKYFVTFIDDASRAVVRLPDPKLKTLSERGIECIFVGYAEHSKGFRFYVIEPNESVSINSIIESRDAMFDENRFSLVPRPSLRIPNGIEDIGGSVLPEEVTEEVIRQPKPELNKGKRNRTLKNFGPEFQLYLIKETRDEDVAFWKEAINDEMDFIMGNNTWVLADLPPGYKPLGCKWIFKRKLKVDGTIEKFKARLVI